jgi:DNA-binding NtrC family response regulator
MPLAKHFLYEFSRKFGRKFDGFSSQAGKSLEVYNWTGNVRELKNVIERGVLVGKGSVLEAEDLGLGASSKNDTIQQTKGEFAFPPLPETGIDRILAQESLEKYCIEVALRMAKGNESKAAKRLNINHHTFRYRRKKLQIG